MGTKSLLCHACHADLPLGKDNQRFIKCPFCGCVNVLEHRDEVFKEKIDETYRLIRDAEFESANEELRELLRKYPDEGELYFMKVLVDSRIIYVDDGEKKTPTYTSVNFDIDSSTYVNKSLELAKYPEQKEFFQKQYDIIAADKKAIKELVESHDKNNQFDVFISFKKTSLDNKNEDTKEAKIAENIYLHLLKEHKNLNIFFAPQTIRGGDNWERTIFNALYRSKCMIVIGSKQDNLNAPWVKNEWNRYIEMTNMGKKNKGSLIPIVVDGDPYEVLPAKLGKIECFKNDINLMYKLDNRVKEIFKVEKTKQNKGLTIQEFEEYKGETVQTEVHSHEIDASLNKIKKLAKTDADLALEELKAFDENDQMVKELAFEIKYGDLGDKQTYLKNGDADDFFEELSKVISASNVDNIVATINSVILLDDKTIKDKDQLLIYCLKYYNSLNVETQANLLNGLYSTIDKYLTAKNKDDYENNKISELSQFVDIFLGIKEANKDKKQDLLYRFCIYLLSFKIPEDKEKTNRIIDARERIIELAKKYLAYLENKTTTALEKDKVFDLSKMGFDRSNFAPFIKSELTTRKMVYAKMLGFNYDVESADAKFSREEKNKYLDAEIDLINQVVDECDDKEAHTLVALYYYLMRLEVRKAVVNNSKDYSNIDGVYRKCQFALTDIRNNDKSGQFIKQYHESILLFLKKFEEDMVGGDYFSYIYDFKIPDEAKCIETYDKPFFDYLTNFYKEIHDKRRNISRGEFNIYTDKESYFYLRNELADKKLVAISQKEKCPYYLEALIERLKEMGEDQKVIDEYQKEYDAINANFNAKSYALKKKLQRNSRAIAIGVSTILLMVITVLTTAFFNPILESAPILLPILSTLSLAMFVLPAIVDLEQELETNKYTRIIRHIFVYYCAFVIFYVCMHFKEFNVATAIILIVESAIVIVARGVVNCIDGFDMYEPDAPALVCVFESILTYGLLIATIMPFLLRNFSLSENFTFYVDGIFDDSNIASPGFYVLFVGILIAYSATCLVRYYFYWDAETYEGEISLIYYLVAAGVIFLAMSVACVFMYFLPNPNLFSVIAFSILSYGVTIGCVAGLAANAL